MTKCFVTLLAVVTVAVAACSDDGEAPRAGPTSTDGTHSTETPTPTSIPSTSASDAALGDGGGPCDPRIDESLTAWAEAGFSGSIAISTGGEIECAAAYGLADEATGTPNTGDTVFSIGSVSKAFTAASIFKLVDDDVLSLDDRAGEIIPNLDGPVADATIEQLLLHTSGLAGSHGTDHEPLERAEAVAAISGMELASDPGSDYLYSNGGYTLLALIVDGVTDAGHREYLASEILPLPDGTVAGGFWDGDPAAPGPRAVGYLDDGPTTEMGEFAGPHWALAGNGDLAMTTRDLATWTQALFTGQVVSRESADRIGTPGFDHGDGNAETPGWVAFDASVLGVPVLAAAGGGGDVGHNVVVAWLPGSERAIAIASNTSEVTAEELLQAVGPSLLTGEPLPVPDIPVAADPADLQAATGTYDLDTGGHLEVVAHDDQLVVAAVGSDAIEALFPLSGNYTAADVATHEEHVQALLQGESQQGREELDVLESELGAIDDVELVGTVSEGSELRTYVVITSDSDSITAWYNLDEFGAVAAAEIDTQPPSLPLVPVGDGKYRPGGPTGPDVTVGFDDGHMTITGPAGTSTARRARCDGCGG